METVTVTVRELRQLLEKYVLQGKVKPSDEVWLSSDPSGSDSSPLKKFYATEKILTSDSDTEYNVEIAEGKIIFYPPS